MVAKTPGRPNEGSGRRFPALRGVCLGLALALCGQSLPIAAQTPPPARPSSVPIPDALELNKMVWSTMAAVHHANLAGNYSVLRDLAATGFQVQNDSASLAQTFLSLRKSGIDLSNTLLLTPTYSVPPKLLSPTVIELRGFFGLRPTAIEFDLVYEWSAGRWRLFGVSIAPANLAQIQSGPPVQPPAQQQPPPAKPRR